MYGLIHLEVAVSSFSIPRKETTNIDDKDQQKKGLASYIIIATHITILSPGLGKEGRLLFKNAELVIIVSVSCYLRAKELVCSYVSIIILSNSKTYPCERILEYPQTVAIQ